MYRPLKYGNTTSELFKSVSGMDPGGFLNGCGGGGGVDLIKFLYVFEKTGPNKQNTASDQGLRCLPLIQQFYTAFKGSKIDLLKRNIR